MFKDIFPLFKTITNYKESLAKIAFYTFVFTLIFQFIILPSPEVSLFYEMLVEVTKLRGVLNGVGLPEAVAKYPFVFLIAIIVGLMSNFTKLHDLISDLIGIRKFFDVKIILMRLALLSGAPMTSTKLDRMAGSRDTLMYSCFYRHASSSEKDPLAGKHEIEQAMNSWCWFWIIVEASLIAVAFLVISLLVDYPVGIYFFAVTLTVFNILGFWNFWRLDKYTNPQIDNILRNNDAKMKIREEFDAL